MILASWLCSRLCHRPRALSKWRHHESFMAASRRLHKSWNSIVRRPLSPQSRRYGDNRLPLLSLFFFPLYARIMAFQTSSRKSHRGPPKLPSLLVGSWEPFYFLAMHQYAFCFFAVQPPAPRERHPTSHLIPLARAPLVTLCVLASLRITVSRWHHVRQTPPKSCPQRLHPSSFSRPSIPMVARHKQSPLTLSSLPCVPAFRSTLPTPIGAHGCSWPSSRPVI